MLSLFASIRPLADLRKVAREASPSLVLHRATALLLFASCLLVSAFQYFGQPIQCVQDKKDEDAAINERVMNSFCFVASTYTVSVDDLGRDCSGQPLPHLGPDFQRGIRRQSYYVWVPFLLFFQGLTFLLPHAYWSYCEGDTVSKLLSHLTGLDLQLHSDEEPPERIRTVAAYVHGRRHSHRVLAFAWILSDALAVTLAAVNFFLADVLLGGRFREYGLKAVVFDPSACTEPMADAFPKLTKCTFYKFGAGGGLQNFDSLCVLALNVVNEKVYLILWFWLMVLAPLTLASLLVKTASMLCLWLLPGERLARLLRTSAGRFLVGAAGETPPGALRAFARDFDAGDWIFYRRLAGGMSGKARRRFASCLHDLLLQPR